MVLIVDVVVDFLLCVFGACINVVDVVAQIQVIIYRMVPAFRVEVFVGLGGFFTDINMFYVEIQLFLRAKSNIENQHKMRMNVDDWG